MSDAGLRVLASRCHTSSCCPAVLESPGSDEIVIIGSLASSLLTIAKVQEKVGTAEAAVVIPKSLLLEACSVILYHNKES